MRSNAVDALPRTTRRALLKLGRDIAVARKKRRISTASMAERAFTSRATLQRLERGDPSVSIGIYASVLEILGFTETLAKLADPSADQLGLDLEEERLPKAIVARRRRKASDG